jgi:hypothetical protein
MRGYHPHLVPENRQWPRKGSAGETPKLTGAGLAVIVSGGNARSPFTRQREAAHRRRVWRDDAAWGSPSAALIAGAALLVAIVPLSLSSVFLSNPIKASVEHAKSHRTFKRQFNLADYVQVKGATFDNGLLQIELVREIPAAMKPRRIEINGSAGSNVQQIDTKAA